ncbi:MAG: hypothetical protein JNJ83_16955 [Verrucomicrobiaceae bacterium]|nr:hypothetical protein [Verrucomicrobiaceae bacterium]
MNGSIDEQGSRQTDLGIQIEEADIEVLAKRLEELKKERSRQEATELRAKIESLEHRIGRLHEDLEAESTINAEICWHVIELLKWAREKKLTGLPHEQLLWESCKIRALVHQLKVDS